MFSTVTNATRILSSLGWREFALRLDQKLGTGVFDFSPCKVTDPNGQRTIQHRASASDLLATLAKLRVKPDSSILDIGSGKGRAMIAMARYPFRRIAGIEISPELVAVAQQNLSRLFLTRRSEILQADAMSFEGYDNFNYLFLYNPFDDSVLREVMSRIHASLKRRPRECWLIYTAPLFEQVICERGGFEKVLEHKPKDRKPTVVYYHPNLNFTS